MKSIVSQIEFARICGVSKQSVCNAVRRGKIKVNSKRLVILNDPINELWRSKRLVSPATQQAPAASTGEATPSAPKGSLVSLHQEKLEEEIGKIRAERKLKEMKFRVEREELIDKGTTGAVLFQYLDALNNNMLSIPEMVIDSMIDQVKAGAPRGSLLKTMRDMIQLEISTTKAQITDRLA